MIPLNGVLNIDFLEFRTDDINGDGVQGNVKIEIRPVPNGDSSLAPTWGNGTTVIAATSGDYPGTADEWQTLSLGLAPGTAVQFRFSNLSAFNVYLSARVIANEDI